MDEDLARSLLTRIADAPEPPFTRIDIERARRDGRRRRLIARAVIPAAALAAVVVALGVIVTVPHALSLSTERARPSAAPSQPAGRVTTAPAQFNPLVPYAAFGWLPSGFSEASVSALDGGAFTTDPSTVTRTATQASTTRMLQLTVSSAGACQGITARPGHPAPSGGVPQDCAFSGYGITGTATSIDGRPAYWVHYDSLAWEYAPGAWATLTAQVQPQQGGGPVSSFANGWMMRLAKNLVARTVREDSAISNIIDNEPQLAIRKGYVVLPSAATLALLEKVAGRVKFGQEQPIVSPFQLAGGLPAGWQLSPQDAVSFRVSGGRLLGTGISAGPAADPTALSAGASAPDGYGCNFVNGQSAYVTRYGVSWIYRVIDEVDKHVEMLCSTEPVDGLDIAISLDMNTPGSNAPLPGSASLGGVFGVFTRMKFLGANPANWTPAPLG